MIIIFGPASVGPNCFWFILKTREGAPLPDDNQKIVAQQLLRKVLRDLEKAARLLDPSEVTVLQRLRSASLDVKRAEVQLR